MNEMEDVTVENVEKIIQTNVAVLKDEERKCIEKQVNDMQKEVNFAYRTGYILPYVFYGNNKYGKAGSKQIDSKVQQEAIKRFKEKTGFRCLKTKQSKFHFLKYQSIYRFVITYLQDDELLLKSIKENNLRDWKLEIVKEY